MPLYEYECEKCAHRFERIQKFSDPPVDTCPVCSGGVKKLLSSPAIQFKGSGWYVTDYARKPSVDGGKTLKDSGGGTASTESKSSSDSGGTSTPASPAKSET